MCVCGRARGTTNTTWADVKTLNTSELPDRSRRGSASAPSRWRHMTTAGVTDAAPLSSRRHGNRLRTQKVPACKTCKCQRLTCTRMGVAVWSTPARRSRGARRTSSRPHQLRSGTTLNRAFPANIKGWPTCMCLCTHTVCVRVCFLFCECMSGATRRL